jgi:hypothetical protein
VNISLTFFCCKAQKETMNFNNQKVKIEPLVDPRTTEIKLRLPMYLIIRIDGATKIKHEHDNLWKAHKHQQGGGDILIARKRPQSERTCLVRINEATQQQKMKMTTN